MTNSTETDKFIFSADWHLKLRGFGRDEIQGDARYALRQLVTACIENKAGLIGGGDLFDSPRPTTDMLCLARNELSQLQKAGLPFLYIQGNHDAAGDTSWMELLFPDWAEHLDFAPVDWGDAVLRGYDWRRGDDQRARLAAARKRDRPQVVVAHQRFSEWMGESRSEMRLADFDADVVLAGDFHEAQVAKFDRGGVESLAYSPGSLWAQNLAEHGSRQVLLFHGPLRPPVAIEINRRPVIEATLNAAATWKAVNDYIDKIVAVAAVELAGYPNELRSCVLVVRYPENWKDVGRLPALAEKYRDTCHIFLKPLSREGGAFFLGRAATIAENDPVGFVRSVIDAAVKNDVAALAAIAPKAVDLSMRDVEFLRDLLSAADPVDAVRASCRAFETELSVAN